MKKVRTHYEAHWETHLFLLLRHGFDHLHVVILKGQHDPRVCAAKITFYELSYGASEERPQVVAESPPTGSPFVEVETYLRGYLDVLSTGTKGRHIDEAKIGDTDEGARRSKNFLATLKLANLMGALGPLQVSSADTSLYPLGAPEEEVTKKTRHDNNRNDRMRY